MIPKPKYIEKILEITKESNDYLACDVVCTCGSKNFVVYKNRIIKSDNQKKQEKDFEKFCKKYHSLTFENEDGKLYAYGKGLFGLKSKEKLEMKSFDDTVIIKIVCPACGKEYIIFDSRFNGYDANIPERDSKYDDLVYEFRKVNWKNDESGIVALSFKINNDSSLEKFIENAYETDYENYSNSFSWITIKAKNVKTNVSKTILDLETA